MTISEFEQIPIPVVEIFQSISGEGISAGNMVSFVRVAGCDLRCVWCDTKYSFNENSENIRMLLPSDISKELSDAGYIEIICTGGEPLEENKSKRYLPAYLAAKKFIVRIETSGGSRLYSSVELKDFNIDRAQIAYCMDIKCPGSKMQDKNLYDNIPELLAKDELKFVVADISDLNFSLDIIDKYKSHLSEARIALNFSPVFGSIKPVEIVEFLKEHSKYFIENKLWARLSLQLHKFVWPPHQRGV
jgi:7-carboxy-7-deazaguanine synthase